ncbi:hypothetical protein Tco_0892526 [Tanacetum coccineum]|uniref:Uncharacterized protein n=1 Tax=Tanacetum coccineum TaxID=301880 RepID=A0ABQ5CBI8_9ASTR
MAVLESCPKHNMVAYLEKTDGNTEFHEIISFLTRSSIHYALTVSPVVSTTFVEQFWMSAKSKIINNVRYITAKVAGKPMSISKASIRSDLLFDDADGIDSLLNRAIIDAIQLMEYEGDLTVLTFNKALFSPHWRFLFHTMNHCISSKSTSWDQIPTNIATAVICLTTNQKYNLSKLIFDGMMRHLDAKKKFVMYPRFISVFLDTQLKNVPVPLDHFPINALTSKVFSFMVKKGKHFSGNVTPLFDSMLVQPTEDEEGSGGNHGGQSSSDRSLSGNEGGMTLQSVYDLCISLCTQVTDQAKEIKHLKAQIKKLKKKAKPVITYHKAWMKSGRKPAKAEPTVHKDPAFDELDDDTMDSIDYIESEDAKDKGRTSSVVLEEKESIQKGVSTKVEVSTVKPDEGTDKSKEIKVSTDKLDEGTVKPKNGTSDESTAPTTVFRDDETIAEFLVSMSQNKAKPKRLQEEERETFIVKERAKFLYDTIAAQRRFLAQQRDAEIRGRPPTRTQLRNQMMTYLKHVEGKKHADLKNKNLKNTKEKDWTVKKIARKSQDHNIDDDNDDEHRKCLRIVTFESTVDSEIIETKSFVSKFHKVSSPDGDYFVVYRVNGHFRAFNYLMGIKMDTEESKLKKIRSRFDKCLDTSS